MIPTDELLSHPDNIRIYGDNAYMRAHKYENIRALVSIKRWWEPYYGGEGKGPNGNTGSWISGKSLLGRAT